MPYVFWLRLSRYLHRASCLLERVQDWAAHLSYRAFERAVRRMLAE